MPRLKELKSSFSPGKGAGNRRKIPVRCIQTKRVSKNPVRYLTDQPGAEGTEVLHGIKRGLKILEGKSKLKKPQDRKE